MQCTCTADKAVWFRLWHVAFRARVAVTPLNKLVASQYVSAASAGLGVLPPSCPAAPLRGVHFALHCVRIDR